ncbi:glycoside hydrolase family 23 protein [Phlebiopsis gigantea 11061_1 CR5-6]|uniref:Glycoside hydrolase family 23 protein n=1 Tax=Phlebiopsis gigantea (strain 11061_1 CR5-6) TaxID=745531 RepID=A0A0C3S352_PHLG1|nr:glycoside hydrolase family 23 protein [Phlebiopsis gigantea 11061_1 CR5-6]
MKLTAPFVWLVLAVGIAEAAYPHAEGGLLERSRHHARLSNQHRDLVDGRTRNRRDSTSKRCKPRTTSLAAPSTTSVKATPSPSPAKAVAEHKTSSSKSASPAKNTSAASQSTSNINTSTAGNCGASGATEKLTATTGPNGSEDWFNCGIESGGWTPPPFTVNEVITKDLAAAVAEKNSPFSNCAAFIDDFYAAQSKHGIPAIFFASIAMQESSCDPNEVGGAGEQGLMQITKDKCGGAPGGNCKEPSFNIDVGAGFFAGLIKQNGGNILPAIGEYNGWKLKMTKEQATAAAHTNCCPCQNNLDYLTQFLNGWVLGNDPTGSLRIGSFFNLDICHTGQ